ncbi:MAG: sulfite exporter TauE/SafE family protein [Alphaproteobacteria bacterium]|nr:sulfite exporter TauE/SafE family protein [Alphaproteobacteria bacterium]
MELLDIVLLTAAFALVASLYSSVGHAGASGYLACMALLSVPPTVMRPTALVLNVLAATITTISFHRAGFRPWRPLLPLIAASIPAAFVGGAIKPEPHIYQALVGAMLLLSSAWLIYGTWRNQAAIANDKAPSLSLLLAVPLGGAIGFLSGITGTGGGIFLSPVLLLAGLAGPRWTSAMAAPFILVNSIAGLAGNIYATQFLPAALPIWIVAVAAGALLGSWLGARRLSAKAIRTALAVVMLMAGSKLLLS